MGTLSIPLWTRKRSEYTALIDEEYAEIVLQYRWHPKQSLNTQYATTQTHGRHVRLHRLIMGEPIGIFVDHINGDGLDCRRINLRLANHSQNHMNRQADSRNKSGFKGVNKSPKANRWYAFITKPGERKSSYIGCFKSAEEAAHAYDEAARIFHGKFACVNFPREGERGARKDV